jgi:DNA-binding transcriptional MerR regulator
VSKPAADPAAPGRAAEEADGGSQLLKIGELADRSGVPSATIRHYVREGLLPEPVKTSRNMAYYPAEFVDRIRLIKQLQEERFMPLKVIREVLAGEKERTSAAEVRRRYDVPKAVLDRLAELGVLSPERGGYSPSDVRIVEAISRFRAGGYDERVGFTVYDTLRYKRALEAIAAEEVKVLTERLGDVAPDQAVEMIEAGVEPLNDLISALHTKLLVAELERLRGEREPKDG